MTPEPIKRLIGFRYVARRMIHTRQSVKNMISETERRAAFATAIQNEGARRSAESALEKQRELDLDIKFSLISIGRGLPALCQEIDALNCRSLVFDAINVNRADRDTPMVAEYGDTTMGLIAVLGLENSATRDDDIAVRPLKWCATLAMVHLSRTNSAMARTMHDAANDVFGGALGEYKPRPLMRRLVGI